MNDVLTSNDTPTSLAPARPKRAVDWVVALLVVLLIAGIAARIVLSAISLGSNDWVTWRWFGALTLVTGPSIYELEPSANHPPIPLLWSAVSLIIASLADPRLFRPDLTGGFTEIGFPFLFRLPMILADLGSALVLRKIWLGSASSGATSISRNRVAWLAAVLMAWNPCAILVGAYHCNTDNLVAFFVLLAAWQVGGRKSGWAGGLALAAAINVKVIGLLFVPVLLAYTCRNLGWKHAGRCAAGLLVGAVPFLIPLYFVPHAFLKNVLGYSPAPGEWGLMFLAMHLQDFPLTSVTGWRLATWFGANGKYLVLSSVLIVGVAVLLFPKRWSVYQATAIVAGLFLALANGFGFQYAVYLAPILLAAGLRLGALYGVCAGLFLLGAYAQPWLGTLPLRTEFIGQKPSPLPAAIGLVTWCIVVYAVVRLATTSTTATADRGTGVPPVSDDRGTGVPPASDDEKQIEFLGMDRMVFTDSPLSRPPAASYNAPDSPAVGSAGR